MSSRRDTLLAFFNAMASRLGPSHWWPGETPFEVVVGAVLTQNTSWRNVDKALALLRAGGPLTPGRLLAMPVPELEEALRPSGFFRLKAVRLRNLLEFMAAFPGFAACADATHAPAQNAGGSPHSASPASPPLSPAGSPIGLPAASLTTSSGGAALAFMQDRDTDTLRAGLLSVKGVGPETADCILLYALGRPSFVVDAYTRRLLGRHGLLPPDVPYEELRSFFMDVLPLDVTLYNEYHALIVRTGKDFCKKTRPLCHACPLGPFLDGLPAAQTES